jgi:hypothetical protein
MAYDPEDTKDTDAVPATAGLDMDAFADRIAAGVAKGLAASQPRRKVTAGEYARRHTTPYSDGSIKLTRALYQCGARCSPHMLTNREIELANKIDRSGRYINRLVEVILGLDGSEEVVQLRWPCDTPDKRMELKGLARNFEDILQQVVAEQEKQDNEEIAMAEQQVQKGRRPFGNNKAYRDALARREAREAATATP